jgi:SAM-dependent methyltransferase
MEPSVPPAPPPARARLGRTLGVHLNAALPFLYPLRHYARGQVVRGLYHFVADALRYRRLERDARSGFPLRLGMTYPCYVDRYEPAGEVPRHYFWQDLWGARKVFAAGTRVHHDIGSRLDGFIAHCLPFCEVVMLDIRPLPIDVPGLRFVQANCMDMRGIAEGSIASLSSFHAIEHFGLGRYGDPIDPLGHEKAIAELKRVLAPGGQLLFSVPIGLQRLEFNGHRVFDPMTVMRLFEGLELVEFAAVDDANVLHENTRPEDWRGLQYGCGLFHFRKAAHG